MATTTETALAESYKAVSEPQKKDALHLFDQLHLKENSKVLDIGCGTGYLASVMAERVGPGGMVVGVDPDEERIKVAQETYGTLSNLAFFKGSSEEFPEDQYDLIISTYVLHWVKDKEIMFKLVYKSLKPGGKFAFTTPADYAPFYFPLIDLMGPERSKLIKDKVYMAPVEVYKKIATEVGFVIDCLSDELSGMFFASISAMIDWLHASTNGLFDPAVIDETTLKDFTKSYGDGPVDIKRELVTGILTK